MQLPGNSKLGIVYMGIFSIFVQKTETIVKVPNNTGDPKKWNTRLALSIHVFLSLGRGQWETASEVLSMDKYHMPRIKFIWEMVAS